MKTFTAHPMESQSLPECRRGTKSHRNYTGGEGSLYRNATTRQIKKATQLADGSIPLKQIQGRIIRGLARRMVAGEVEHAERIAYGNWD